MENQTTKNNLTIPTAIIIAGVLIAGAIYIGQRGDINNITSPNEAENEQAQLTASLESVSPVTNEDHIRGKSNALVKIVEYSDFECPFCKGFHGTMKQTMDEYGKDGQVAWVYRHFPLDQLHPVKARAEAVASECVNEIAGNDAFWQFTDRFFELTPSNNQTDIKTIIPQIVEEMSISLDQFNTCIDSGKYDQHIQDDIDNAIETGGRGTPWSIVIAPNGKKFPLSGAQPYTSVKQLIDIALNEK